MCDNLAETQAILLFFWGNLLKFRWEFGIIGLEVGRSLSIEFVFVKIPVRTNVTLLKEDCHV